MQSSLLQGPQDLRRPIQAVAGTAGYLSQDSDLYQPFDVPLRRPVGHL